MILQHFKDVLVQAAITKYHRVGGLETTKNYFSQLCWLKVQDQGAIMFGFCEGHSSGLQRAVFSLYPHIVKRK